MTVHIESIYLKICVKRCILKKPVSGVICAFAFQEENANNTMHVQHSVLYAVNLCRTRFPEIGYIC